MLEVEYMGSLLNSLIKKQFRVMTVEAVTPLDNRNYKSIRRGIRWVCTRAGFDYVPEEAIVKGLESIGVDTSKVGIKPYKPKDRIKK